MSDPIWSDGRCEPSGLDHSCPVPPLAELFAYVKPLPITQPCRVHASMLSDQELDVLRRTGSVPVGGERRSTYRQRMQESSNVDLMYELLHALARADQMAWEEEI